MMSIEEDEISVSSGSSLSVQSTGSSKKDARKSTLRQKSQSKHAATNETRSKIAVKQEWKAKDDELHASCQFNTKCEQRKEKRRERKEKRAERREKRTEKRTERTEKR
jgi:hypothetical protein